MPQVCVIIATFNHADYLADAVDSVLDQSFADWELVVVDDGSTDRTPAVLAGVVAAHPGRLRTVRQDNAGVGAAMNRGLAESSAPLVAFLDSDDTWAPDHLATLVPLLADRPAAVLAFGRRDAIDARGRPVDRPAKPYHSGHVTTELFRSVFISKICLLARRAAIEQAGRFDTALRMGEDYELMLRLSRLGELVGCDAIVAHRRRHAGNLTADTPAYRVRTAALLERFYFKLDGWRAVEPAVGQARLARLHYSAGKKLLAGGDGLSARFHLARSIAFAATTRTVLLRAAALLACPFRRRRIAPDLPEDYRFIPTEQARRMLDRAANG